jgi:hypothetical protein
MSSLRHLFLVSALLALLALGCGGGGPRVVNVTGTVTRGGKPVEKLFLNFVPDNGRPSWGVTDAEGHYSLHYDRERDGAIVGSHRVWVQVRPTSPTEEAALARGTLKIHPEIQQILSKYGKPNTSPLVVEVTGDNAVIDLALD